ncbi:MAG: cyclase family protein [Planctomycetota bacterium]
MIHDISPLLDPDVAVWPGDSPYEAKDLLRIEDGNSVHLSTISLSCHTGAHADAPCHYVKGAPGIDEADLAKYIGPATLVDVEPTDHAIRPDDLPHFEWSPRILLRTGAMRDRKVFPDPLTCLTVELIEHLAERGCVLIGLDSPSVDRFDSKDLPCHKALYEHGIVNLECLALEGVPAGRYELIALPLRLKGRDASPVRAILREIGSENAPR